MFLLHPSPTRRGMLLSHWDATPVARTHPHRLLLWPWLFIDAHAMFCVKAVKGGDRPGSGRRTDTDSAPASFSAQVRR